MASGTSSRALALVRAMGVVRARELREQGIPAAVLGRLCDQGLLERAGRGLYRLPGAPLTRDHALALMAKRVPKGIVCLLSALRFLELTTQQPHEVWVAIDEKDWAPRVDWPAIRVVRMSGRARSSGVERHRIELVPVLVFSPAKTVADCFKFRNKIGLDVAVEALKDYLAKHRGGADELWRQARVCRVEKILRPYMEGML